MLMKLISWLMTFILAFSLGTSVNAPEKETDSELQQKVQDHMDVIVDEAAAILDEVSDEVRKNEKVQKAEEFVDNVKEIAQNTADDIKAHFATEEEIAAAEEQAAMEEKNRTSNGLLLDTCKHMRFIRDNYFSSYHLKH